LVGNDCLSDRIGKQRYRERAGIETPCSTNHTFPREGYVLNIIGDYMIECILPKELSDAYHDLFVREDLSPDDVSQRCRELFMADYQCKLMVRQHKTQSSNYKSSIFKSLKR
jgi:hypothetical protein